MNNILWFPAVLRITSTIWPSDHTAVSDMHKTSFCLFDGWDSGKFYLHFVPPFLLVGKTLGHSGLKEAKAFSSLVPDGGNGWSRNQDVLCHPDTVQPQWSQISHGLLFSHYETLARGESLIPVSSCTTFAYGWNAAIQVQIREPKSAGHPHVRGRRSLVVMEGGGKASENYGGDGGYACTPCTVE